MYTFSKIVSVFRCYNFFLIRKLKWGSLRSFGNKYILAAALPATSHPHPQRLHPPPQYNSVTGKLAENPKVGKNAQNSPMVHCQQYRHFLSCTVKRRYAEPAKL
jgi:hypothetical protein